MLWIIPHSKREEFSRAMVVWLEMIASRFEVQPLKVSFGNLERVQEEKFLKE